MKKFDVEIKNCLGNQDEFYVLLNDEKLSLAKTPQGRRGTLEIQEGDNILEIKKRYHLDNGLLGIFCAWVKHLFWEDVDTGFSDDGKDYYNFKMKFNLKNDSQGKFYIVDRKSTLADPISYEIFSSTEYKILENKCIENSKMPRGYEIYTALKYGVGLAIVCTLVLLFIY